MASPVSICNIALARIGHTRGIADLDEASLDAQACKIYYEHDRDIVLAAAPWYFNTRRKALASTGTPPIEWLFRFALPDDCLKPMQIADDRRVRLSDDRIPFALEDDGSGGSTILLCDVKAPNLIYLARLTQTGLYPPVFVNALAWLIAADLAVSLSLKLDFEKQMRERYVMAINEAVALVLGTAQPDPLPDSEFISARV